MWAALKLIVMVVTALPSVVKAVKDLIDLAGGDKKLAKQTFKDICKTENLKNHVDKCQHG